MRTPPDTASTATRTFHSYAPDKGHGLRHDPLGIIVGPRPIGWISTVSEDGVANLAPYSFFNLFNYHPPILGFASIGWKDSVANIESTGEFVWNMVTRDLAEPMNRTSASAAAEVDEFALAGLARLPSQCVRPPRVAAAHVTMECRRTAVHRLTDVDGTGLDTWLVLGQVMMVHLAQELVTDRSYDPSRVQPVLRGGGPSAYYAITEAARFDIQRPG